MKIGLIGGTFDPIHVGHLLLGEWAREHFALDEIWFLPAGMPYFKEDKKVSSRLDRWAMTRRAVADMPGAKACDIELMREGRTYTYETVEELCAAYPDDEFTFVFGADCLDQLDTWRYPERILAGCRIVAATRGASSDVEEMRRKAAALTAKFGGKIEVMEFPALEISSTMLRERAAKGLPLKYLVPEAVENYAIKQGLYGSPLQEEDKPNPVKAVILDMDGTLLDTEKLYIDVWMDLEENPTPKLEQVLYDVIGVTEEETRAHFAEVMGADYPFEALRTRMKNIFAQIRDAGQLPVKAGAKECLDALYRAGYKLALASSSYRDTVEAEMKAAGLFGYFDVIVCGTDISHSKPDPEIFLKTARLLETDPSECIVIEDSFNGIRAAKAAGMRPLMVPDLKQPDEEIRGLCEWICPDLPVALATIREADH